MPEFPAKEIRLGLARELHLMAIAGLAWWAIKKGNNCLMPFRKGTKKDTPTPQA